MKIANKTVIRAEVQTWIGITWDAKHFHGYLFNTETGKEHQTRFEYFTEKEAAVGCMALFMEFYNPQEYVFIMCSRATYCTI